MADYQTLFDHCPLVIEEAPSKRRQTCSTKFITTFWRAKLLNKELA